MNPKKIKSVKAKKAFFLPSGFKALTWKGVVYCKHNKDVEAINKTEEINNDLECHETIHVRQAESMHNSWLLFYCRYLFDWICNFPLFLNGFRMPYFFIATEMEAHLHENEWNYCQNGQVIQWKKFEKLSLIEKFKLSKKYKKVSGALRFRNFMKQEFAYGIAP